MNGRENAVVRVEEQVEEEEDGAGTGPARTRADRDRIPGNSEFIEVCYN